MTTTETTGPVTSHESRRLWAGATLTAAAALLFPRLNAVLYHDQAMYQLDREAAFLAPLVLAVCLALFGLLGQRLWRSSHTAVSCAALGFAAVLGLLAFWISAAILLGGLAVTLGQESLRRPGQSPAVAWAGITLGGLAGTANATIWVFDLL